jgi:hypothetical protein
VRVNFGNLPEFTPPKRSQSTYLAFTDTECDICLQPIEEGEDLGFVYGDRACLWCWEEPDDEC